jgi:hypothetical protein
MRPGAGAASPPSITKQVAALLVVWLLSLAALIAGAAPQIRRYSQGRLFAAAVLAAFALQLGLYWLPGFPALRKRFEAAFGRQARAAAIGILLLVPYCIYGLGTHAWSLVGASKLIGLAAVVLGTYALFPPRSDSLCWQDVVVLGVVAAPVYVGFYRNIFPVPVYLDVMARLFVVALAAFAVLSIRQLPGTGFGWRLAAGDWLEGGKQLVFYSIIAVPLGLAMRFIAWHPQQQHAADIAFSFLGIFLFIAVAEELFFRGMLQNLLEKTLSNKYAARAIAAGLFGLSHIHHNFPNWRYVIMAAIAGWFYGTAWHNRRSIVASCVTHAAVDTIWRHWLTA